MGDLTEDNAVKMEIQPDNLATGINTDSDDDIQFVGMYVKEIPILTINDRETIQKGYILDDNESSLTYSNKSIKAKTPKRSRSDVDKDVPKSLNVSSKKKINKTSAHYQNSLFDNLNKRETASGKNTQDANETKAVEDSQSMEVKLKHTLFQSPEVKKEHLSATKKSNSAIIEVELQDKDTGYSVEEELVECDVFSEVSQDVKRFKPSTNTSSTRNTSNYNNKEIIESCETSENTIHNSISHKDRHIEKVGNKKQNVVCYETKSIKNELENKNQHSKQNRKKNEGDKIKVNNKKENKRDKNLQEKDKLSHSKDTTDIKTEFNAIKNTIVIKNESGNFSSGQNEVSKSQDNSLSKLARNCMENLPAKMTFRDESNIVYNIPLLNIPHSKQVVHFSPEYLKQFLEKIRLVFNIERFLRITPDPFTFFTKVKNNQLRYNERCLGLIYLKGRYRRTLFGDIDSTFEKNAYNLTVTCEELEKWTTHRRKKSRGIIKGCVCQVPHELTMAFIHEVTFIEHRKSIEVYLKAKHHKDSLALSVARENGVAQKCENCGTHCLVADVIECRDDHTFCKTCIQSVIETRLQNGLNPLPCLRDDCEWGFAFEVLKKSVTPVTFSSLLHFDHMQQIKQAGLKLLETCPSCGFADNPSDEEVVFHCLNPECMKETCRNCKAPYYYSHQCARLAIEAQGTTSTVVTSIAIKKP